MMTRFIFNLLGVFLAAYVTTARARVPTCQELLEHLQMATTLFRVAQTSAEVEALNESLGKIFEFLDHRGLKAHFIRRHIHALATPAMHFNLRVEDIRSDTFDQIIGNFFAERADAVRAELRRIDGAFLSSPIEGRWKFAIGINPASRRIGIDRTLAEELMHMRFRMFVLTTAHMHSSRRESPFILQSQQKHILGFVDEFIAKDGVAKFGRGQPLDRSELMGTLLTYVTEKEDSRVGFGLFVRSVVACADRAGVSWKALKSYRFLRCLLALPDQAAFVALINRADPAVSRNLMESALESNWSRAPRRPTRLTSPAAPNSRARDRHDARGA